MSELPTANNWLRIGYIILFLTLPWSLAVSLGTHQLTLPSEPLLLLMATVLLWYFPWSQWQRFLRQPITLLAVLHLGSMVLSIAWSVDTVVSLKYTLVEGLHWFVFYLGFLYCQQSSATGQHLFRQSIAGYFISFSLIMVYAWYQHAQYQFSMDTSLLAARPFYFDHALYGSCAALLLGPTVHLATQSKGTLRISYGLGSGLLLIAIYLSFSRAVWASLVIAAVFVTLLYWLRPKFWPLVGGLVGLILLIICTATFWLPLLQKNQAASKSSTLSEQISSIGNITTDVSNLERINRYSCAWRMFLDRPLTGFGVGTYQTAYLSYQRPAEMTRISVTHAGPHPPGRGGGAHSEYLQVLSERGLLGALTWLGLILAVLYTCLLPSNTNHIATYLLLFSLCTFFIHGFFNNFLHYGKFASLFWIIMAYLTASSHKT